MLRRCLILWSLMDSLKEDGVYALFHVNNRSLLVCLWYKLISIVPVFMNRMQLQTDHVSKKTIFVSEILYMWFSVEHTQSFQYLRYSIPQVWIDNSYQANPGNSCNSCFLFSTRGTKITGLQVRGTLQCRDHTQHADQIVTMRLT